MTSSDPPLASLPRTPSLRLHGRRALVTGASRGLGLAAAAALAGAGAEVVLVARSTEEVAAVAEQIARLCGTPATGVPLDVTDLEAVNRFFEERDPFDILVNNAGTNRPKPIWEVEEADYDLVLGLNLKSAFFVARAAAKRMIESSMEGSLIHMSSQMGHVGAPNRSLYCASKWAIEGMSKALAVELARFGIRSNTIAPTFIETEMTKPFLADPAFASEIGGKIKLGRLGVPEDIMGATLFLASDASRLMTGTSLVVDGGWTAD